MTWSQRIRLRDKVCQSCGTNEHLEAHHILYWSMYPQLSDDIENGITLCRKCHRAAHNGSFHPKGTTLQALEKNPLEVKQKIRQFIENNGETFEDFQKRMLLKYNIDKIG